MGLIRNVIGKHRWTLLALLAVPPVASTAFVALDAAFAGREATTPPAPRPRVALPEGEAYLAEFSPDARLLFTAGRSGACIRDAATGRVRVTLTDSEGKALEPADELTWPRFTPDSRRLIVQLGGSRFRRHAPISLKVFDVATGRQRASFDGVGWRIWWGTGVPPPEYELSTDGSALAFARGPERIPPNGTGPDRTTDRVLVWDVVGERIVADVPGALPLALSADGRALAYRVSAADPYRLAIRDVAASRPEATFEVEHGGSDQDGAPTVIAFSPDGKLLAMDHGRSTELRDAANGQSRAVLRAAPNEGFFWPQAAWFSPDSRLLFLENRGGHGSRALLQWWHFDGSSWRKGPFGPPGGFTPDGRRAVLASQPNYGFTRHIPLVRNDSVVSVIDLSFPRERVRIVETGVHDAVISPDGRLLALATSRQEPDQPPESPRVRIELMLRLRSPRSPTDGPFRDVHEVKIYEAATGRSLGTIDRPSRQSEPSALTFAPDGKTLAIHETPKGLPLDVGMPELDRSVEFWDVPPPSRPTPPAPLRRPIGGIAALTALVAALPLALGLWLDHRRSARAVGR